MRNQRSQWVDQARVDAGLFETWRPGCSPRVSRAKWLTHGRWTRCHTRGRPENLIGEERLMSLRPVKRLIKSKPTLEGAGVHLRRAFGFGNTTDFDPFLLLDD